MDICIVGCGNQGVGMAGLLLRESDVERMVLIDSDPLRLQGAAAALRTVEDATDGVVVETCQEDASDAASVARLAKGCDVLLNATVPRFNMPLMRAALKAGSHYVDLYSFSRALPDVPDAETVEAQLDLAGEFRQAGLAAFPCLGISPGWTTLAAKYLADGFDTVESLIVRNVDWIESRDLLALCVPEIMLGLFLGPPGPVYLENGAVRGRGLLDSEELYEFPEPVGPRRIYTITSLADAVLTAKLIGKPVGRIEEKGALLSGGLSLKDVWVNALQRQTSRGGAGGDLLTVLGSSFRLATEMDLQDALKEGSVIDGAFASVVEITGTRQSRTTRRTISCVARLQEARRLFPWTVAAAGVFATVGSVPIEVLLMLGRGEISERGVLPVTSIKDVPELFDRMRRRGHQLSETSENMD